MKRIRYNSPVILTFAILALVVLLLSMITNDWTNQHIFSAARRSFTNPFLYTGFFLHILGHANISHLLGNFTIILLAGPILEEKYGSKNMLIMIAVTALFTGLLFVLISPNATLLGASGIAFMLIILCSFVNVEKGTIPLTLILCAAIFLGREIYDGIKSTDNISQLAHILGGICGAGFGFYLNKKKFAGVE